jgi:hypothetical protein
LSWRDLLLIAKFADPTSVLFRAVYGHVWTDTEQLLAIVADSVRAANWQRAGGKGGKPKPLPRPKPKTQARKLSPDEIRDLGRGVARTGSMGTARDMSDVKSWLEAKNGRRR